MIFFTSICANYLPKAMALAESVKRNCRDAKFVLCLVEREVHPAAAAFPHFDEVVLASEAGWENFDSFMFRHSIVEASTAVKPRFMAHLTERYPESDKFVYLDPDTFVYSEFEELEAILEEHSIVVCPHLLRPGNIDMEISSLAHGSYNLGFLAISRAENSRKFLEWWGERLFRFCYDDKSKGIFTDQKWIDLAPSFFDVHILKHHGYDFATWSLLGSRVEPAPEGGGYVVNGEPLRFIHFSGLDSGMIERAMGWWLTPENRPTFEALYQGYVAKLDALGQRELGRTPWSYANYLDGRPVSSIARVRYRDPALWEAFPEPFDACDAAFLAPDDDPAGSPPEQTPVLRMPPNPSIIDRFMWSSLDVGMVPTLGKAFRRMIRGQ